MTARKSIAPKTSAPEIVDAPEIVEDRKQAPSLLLIHATPSIVAKAQDKVTDLLAGYGYHKLSSEKVYETLAVQMLRLRRMFPAPSSVQAILGDDAADLGGTTTAYKNAIGEVYDHARERIVAQLRKDGWTIKGASGEAKALVDTYRKSASVHVRAQLEADLRESGDLDTARKVLLANGFKPSSVQRKGQLLEPGMKLLEDGTLHVPAVDAPPADASDQANPSETADAVAAQVASDLGEMLTNVAGNFNTAAGLIRTALGDKRMPDMPPAARVALVTLIQQLAHETAVAVAATLPEEEAYSVGLTVRRSAHATLTVVDPEGRTAPKAPKAQDKVAPKA